MKIFFNILGGLFLAVAIGFFFAGQKVLAYDRACSADGFTVVYVNGIMTTRDQANDDRVAFNKKFLLKVNIIDMIMNIIDQTNVLLRLKLIKLQHV
jgi:hypothetical protein